MIEENMADFKVNRYQYEDPTPPTKENPQMPSHCLISEVNFDAWFPGCNVTENECESDFNEKKVNPIIFFV